jgi:hypothetical protein
MPPCLNRLLVVVTPKEPFAEWVVGTDPRDKSPPTLADVRRESTAYLIEECDMETEYQRTLRRHFRVIFENELAGWYTLEETWPKNRTFAMFQDWFDVSFISMVNDLAAEPLIVEDFD